MQREVVVDAERGSGRQVMLGGEIVSHPECRGSRHGDSHCPGMAVHLREGGEQQRPQ